MAHGSNGQAGHAPRGAGLGEPLPRPCGARRADAPAPWMPRPGRPPMSGGPWAPSCCNPRQLQLGGTVAAMGHAAGTRAGRGAGPAWAHCPGVRSSTSAGQNHSSLMTRTPLTPPPRDGLGPVSVSPDAGGTSVPNGLVPHSPSPASSAPLLRRAAKGGAHPQSHRPAHRGPPRGCGQWGDGPDPRHTLGAQGSAAHHKAQGTRSFSELIEEAQTSAVNTLSEPGTCFPTARSTAVQGLGLGAAVGVRACDTGRGRGVELGSSKPALPQRPRGAQPPAVVLRPLPRHPARAGVPAPRLLCSDLGSTRLRCGSWGGTLLTPALADRSAPGHVTL